MSVLRDVVDVIHDVSTYEELDFSKHKLKGSLTRMTKDAVLQFPVITSRSIEISLAQLVVKSLERNFGSLLKIAFSLNAITTEKDLTQYIRNFHQNSGSSEREDITNMMINSSISESEILYKVKGDVSPSEKVMIENALSQDNHRLLREYISELNLDKLNDKYSFSEARKYGVNTPPVTGSVPEEYLSTPKRRNTAGSQEDAAKVAANYSPEIENAIGTAPENLKDVISANRGRFMGMSGDLGETPGSQKSTPIIFPKNGKDSKKNIIVKNSDIGAPLSAISKKVYKDNKGPIQYKLPSSTAKMFTDSDIKKSNEIMPLALTVGVYIVNKDGDNEIYQEFILGVKGVIHPVASEYMVSSMIDGYGRNKTFFNFIKATTGEISFFKDFVFMVDKLKKDAIDNASSNNKWFAMLKRRAVMSKAKRILRMKNQLLPNTSVMMSISEVEEIKNSGIDLLNPDVSKSIIEHYLLLAIVIVNEGLETVDILYDGENHFNTYSFSALTKDAKEDSATKQILNLIKSRPQQF
ncbi:MAG: hypothetical protein ACRC0G_07660 [Fusobacteriaceae bacterium]